MTLTVKVTTSNGEYELWKPKGRVGAKHMALLLRFARVAEDAKNTGMSLFDDDRVAELYEEWCEKVLPHIILKSPFKYDDIPFDDMFKIFIEMIMANDLEEDLAESFQEG